MSSSKKHVAKMSYVNFSQDQSEQLHKDDEVKEVQKESNSLANLGTIGNDLKKFVSNISALPKSSNENLKALPHSANPNSIGSVFRKEYQQVSGVDRVFRKSITFLGIHLLAFLVAVLVGLNLFDLNPVFSLFAITTFVASSLIFYIIVADRSYVWLSILGQIFILILASSFYGQGFTLTTLFFSVIIALLSYIGYSELEKVQLSSRLFSIGHITSEAARILITSVSLLISICAFNYIISLGTDNLESPGSTAFLDKEVFSNELIMDNLIIGRFKNVSLNRIYLGGRFNPEGREIVYSRTGKQATFYNFLFENYSTQGVLSENEEESVRTNQCTTAPESVDCNAVVNAEISKRLEEFRLETYPNLPFTLDTKLDTTNFPELLKTFYLEKVANFENTNQDDNGLVPTSLLIVPVNTIIPALFAIGIMIILTLVKFLLGWLVFIFTWIFWKTLVLLGFAQIDVETVEAEIVSI